jgi:hypothetical protein
MPKTTKRSVALADLSQTDQDLPSLVSNSLEKRNCESKNHIYWNGIKERSLRTKAHSYAAGASCRRRFRVGKHPLAFEVSTLFSGLDWSSGRRYAMWAFSSLACVDCYQSE